MTPPFHEPLRKTLSRTVTIAVIAGGVAAVATRRLSAWPVAGLVAFWPSFGGHWVEVAYLNWVRPLVSPNPGLQAAVRVLVWFVGGVLLGLGMRLTAVTLIGWQSPQWVTWWLGGAAFVGAELLIHLLLRLRRQA